MRCGARRPRSRRPSSIAGFLITAVLAALVMLPALAAGWQFDDYFQRATILGHGDSRPINIFVQYIDRAHNLRQMDFGSMPWWGSLDLHLAFLRYTSTLTAMLDYRLWPNHPALMHLHSLLWFAAAVFAAALLYREVLGATWVAGLAALLYALDSAHVIPQSTSQIGTRSSPAASVSSAS